MSDEEEKSNVTAVDFGAGRRREKAPIVGQPSPLVPPNAISKRAVFEALLNHGIVIAQLNLRVGGCVLPEHLMKGPPQVRIDFSYKFGISDFTFDDTQIVATLSFNKVNFRCVIPWACVFGLSSDVVTEAVLWPMSALPFEKRDA